jgi:SAM-dependent methyltransferase
MGFTNCYDDAARAEAYAQLEFANTYYLAYRDLPIIIGEYVTGIRTIDFGCGAGRSTRFARHLGLDVTGVDIAGEMIAQAKAIDPGGAYHLVKEDDLSGFQAGAYDLVLSVFTFDNIPGFERKVRLFRDLGTLLSASGKLISVVSSPEIYLHEWASFSTKDYPENRFARPGDIVRITTTDFADRRPAEDVLWTDESYRDVYARANLAVVATFKPLAHGNEPYQWVNETKIAPWVIYVLQRQAAPDESSAPPEALPES